MIHHVVSGKTNVLVLLGLLTLTALTVLVAYQDLGAMNNVAAIGIACLKAALVIWFFMHVKFASTLVRLGIATGLVFMLILFGFTMADVLTRGMLGVPGK
ncbi:MAG TPA: cytochrome C oxidase subunit IV family protein [Candidatus Krumholzibacteria bacterium]|nr:cytochrome C oxidase subunit IV family protein [Candidatus Krumholzibacteria bacterium]